jgi:accessory gene regulator B
MNINTFSKRLSIKLGQDLNLDDEKVEIIEYGFTVLLSTILSLLLLSVASFLLGVFMFTLTMIVFASPLRMFSGGVHFSTPLRCAVIGAIVYPAAALVIKHSLPVITFEFALIYFVITTAAALVINYVYAPRDVPQKPINNPQRRKALKRKSIAVITASIAVQVCVILVTPGAYHYLLLISTGILLQSVTLLPAAPKAAKFLDKV